MKKSCWIFVAGAMAGSVAALLFAQESGESLRKKLEKSENPLRELFREIVKIKLDGLKWIEKKGREFLQ